MEPTPPSLNIQDVLNASPEQLAVIKETLANNPAARHSVIASVNPQALVSSEERLAQQRFQKRSLQFPYYRLENAQELIPILDEMILDPEKEFDFVYKDYSIKMSAETLHNRIHQSILYIVEQLDPDKRYQKVRSTFQISKALKDRVRLKRIAGIKESLKPRVVSYQSSVDDIKSAIQDFLDTAPTPSKHTLPDADVLPFSFNDSELLTLNNWLEKFKDVLTYVVETDRIVLLKTASLPPMATVSVTEPPVV